MKVDSKKIRTEREKRAWSQEHLAAAAGLGLRTVQRIEATGVASYESVRALAAVLQIEVAALRAAQAEALSPGRRLRTGRSIVGAAAVAIATAGGLFVAATGFAEQILLDVGVSMNDSENRLRQWNRRMLVDEGSLVPDLNDVALFDVFKLEVVPSVTGDGLVLVAFKIFVRNGADYELVTSPSIITASGEEAEIKLSTEDGTWLSFVVTPHRASLL
jgi:transcriptional regulator with XRE-family HTH domain